MAKQPPVVIKETPPKVNRRAYAKGHFEFTLDGHESPGYIKSVAGGLANAEVMSEVIGPDHVAFKHLGTAKIEPVKLELGMALAGPMFDWIRDSWRHGFRRCDGQFRHADGNKHGRLIQEFKRALITETKFPAMDRNARAEQATSYLEVTFLPEEIAINPDPQCYATFGVSPPSQTQWTQENFRFRIDGFEDSSSMVQRIESFSVKQTVKEMYIGAERFPEIEPTGIEFGDINISIAAEFAEDFRAWYQKLVIEGGRETTEQRSGVIEFLDPTMQNTLFEVILTNVGIHSFQVEKNEVSGTGVLSVQVGLHVDSMDLKAGALNGPLTYAT